MALHPIRIESVIVDPAETVRVTRWPPRPARVRRRANRSPCDLEIEAPRSGWLAAIHAAQGAH